MDNKKPQPSGMSYADMAQKIQIIINQPIPIDCSPALAWLEWGADPMLDIFPTLQRVMAQVDGKKAIRSLNFFNNSIKQAIDNRRQKPPSKAAYQPTGQRDQHPWEVAEATRAKLYEDYIASYPMAGLTTREKDFVHEVAHIQAQYVAGVKNIGWGATRLLPYKCSEDNKNAIWLAVSDLCRAAKQSGRLQDPMDIDFTLWA